MRAGTRALTFRFSGILLLCLGLLHLAVTPIIARLVQRGAAADAVDWLTPPMLLNHVVVGILLLPLGVLVFYAAPHAASATRWAVVVTRTVAVTIATLPLTLFFLMGRRYSAIPFQVATAIVCVASLILLVAAFWPTPTRSQP